MSQTDPIADMLSSLRNAVMRRHPKCVLTHSRFREAVLRVLQAEGYVADIQVMPDERLGDKKKWAHVYLKYDEDGEPVMRHIRRVSKPSCRVFGGTREIPKVLDGLGITVLSTSRGVLSDRQARKQKVGGEILCRVW